MNKTIILLTAALMAMTAGCKHDHQPENEAHDEDGATHTDEIVLTAEKAAQAGVTADTVRSGEFYGVVKTSGRILSATDDETTVAATAPGLVTLSSQLTEGMPIGRGATVVSISSSKLPEGDITDRARIAYENARKEYERAEALIADQLITDKEYRSQKAAFEAAELAYKATGRRSGGGVAVSAPTAGYVKELFVKTGDYVATGQPIMTITRNRHQYLRAELPERDYNALGHISSAKFRTAYSDRIYDLADLDGRLVSCGKSSGTAGSFIPVTFEFNNAGGIVAGSYAEIYLLTSPRANVLSLPKSALTEEQGVNFVYVKTDDTCYRKQEVKTGETDGERIEITAGLKDGDVVVTDGAIHVKLASASNSIPGHTHNH